MSDFQKNMAFFVNSNGENEDLFHCLDSLKSNDSTEITALALEELLPSYASFPNPQRKTRLEEILKTATKHELDKFVITAKEKGFAIRDSVVLSGHFPIALEEWLQNNKTDLLVKQSLPCDGNFGYASKGDIKLARHATTPLLLLHSKLNPLNPVLLGLPPIIEEPNNYSFCQRLLTHALQWCNTLNTSLYIVHAWQLFGENALGARIPKEELREELQKIKEKAQAQINKLVRSVPNTNDCKIQIELHKGDPTRILLGEIDVVQPSMVVLGSAANEGIKEVLLGNTAESIVRRKETSVLVIH